MGERVEKVKTHIKEHQVFYGVAAGVTIAGITLVIMRGRCSGSSISSGISGTADRGISVIGKKVNMNNVSYISQNRKGPPSWVVRCTDTGDVFTSQRLAAARFDIPENELSKHLNGIMDSVRGHRFERLCLAA